MSLRHLSINQLSEITGVDRRTIKKRIVNLVPQIEGRGHYYDAHKALPLIFASESKDQMDKKLLAEQLRIDRARAEKLELEVARLRGEVIPIEEVAKEVEHEYTRVRSQIRSIPSKLAKPLSIVTDPHEVYDRLTEVIDECLTELQADTDYEQRRIELDSASASSEGVSSVGIEAASETESGGMGGHVSDSESGE